MGLFAALIAVSFILHEIGGGDPPSFPALESAGHLRPSPVCMITVGFDGRTARISILL